jgi:hypothetical protein
MIDSKKIFKEIEEWSESWMGFTKDIPYGNQLVKIFHPFVENMIEKGLKRKTIKKHTDNLWLLGGEIIRDVNTYEQYDEPPLEMILSNISPEGGPLCRYINSDEEIRSFDSTCKKLYKFLKEKKD